jgi:hypothetical protein
MNNEKKPSQELSQLAQEAGWPVTKFNRAVLECASVFMGHNATHMVSEEPVPDDIRQMYMEIAQILMQVSGMQMREEEQGL